MQRARRRGPAPGNRQSRAEGRRLGGGRAALSAVVELRPEDAEALFGLGTAFWWLGAVPQAMARWEQAYGVSVHAGDQAQAAGTATSLSLLYHANFGNRAQGWAARAERLATALGEPVLWVLIAKAATFLEPDQAEAHGREAKAIAVEAGDRDLELCGGAPTPARRGRGPACPG